MRNQPRILMPVSALLACQLLFAGTLHAADAGSLNAALARIRSSDLRKHVDILASDTFEGREAGSRGGKASGAYLIGKLKKYDILAGGEEGSFYQYFGNDYRNILALLPGSDPQLKNQYLLVGAHYDHVGYGSQTTSLGPIGYIHNGADDNASGTAGLLELIEAFSSLQQRPKRSILFALWDGEEKGLLGSEHWISQPTLKIDRIRFLFNLDMIGRLRKQDVEVFGVRTAVGLRRLLSEQNRGISLQLDFNWNNERNSDHYPFLQQHIPFLMLHTRKHDDYHRPSDDVDKINHAGMEQITHLLFRTIHAMAEMNDLPAFRLESLRENQFDRRRHTTPLTPEPSRLGIAWDSQLDTQGIIRLTDVKPGSPAESAGLKIGDRLLKFDHQEINDQYDFRSIVLAAENPVTIELQRAGIEEPVTISATLIGRPRRIGFAWHVDRTEPDCVILSRIDPGSPAARAGLRPNDRIYAVGEKSFQTSAQFHDLIKSRNPLVLTVEQKGKTRIAHVKLLPNRDEQPVAAIKPTLVLDK